MLGIKDQEKLLKVRADQCWRSRDNIPGMVFKGDWPDYRTVVDETRMNTVEHDRVFENEGLVDAEGVDEIEVLL
jgi:hypothetical protein